MKNRQYKEVKWPSYQNVSSNDHSSIPVTTEVTFGSLCLKMGCPMTLLYNYSSEWTFTITVTAIDADKMNQHILVLLTESNEKTPALPICKQ